jgi:hypothetical protein
MHGACASSIAVICALAVAMAVADDTPATPPQALVTTESRIANASLMAADGGGALTFQGEGGEVAVRVGKVVRWGNFVRASGGHRLRLVHGGEIVGYSITIADRRVTLESDLIDSVNLSRDLVTAVILDMPQDVTSAADLQRRIDAAEQEQDTVLFANGDRLHGEAVSLTDEQLTFKSAASDLAIDRSRVAAVVFGQPPDRARRIGIATRVGLRDGSRVLADKLTLKDGKATIELAGGTTIAVNGDTIVAVQPIGGDAEYLSDRNDDGYRHIPFLSLVWDYGRDRSVTGDPLVADGRLYLKGLGMHSAARITYDLKGQYRAFQAELAIDDATAGQGSVTCRVFTDDGSGKWQLQYESPVIRGGEKPVPVEADLTGAKRISLLVDFADRGDVLDHINWLDARLVK